MNRRNISPVVLFLVVVAFSLGSGCSTGRGGGQPAWPNPIPFQTACHHLRLDVINTKSTPISIPNKGVSCKHGNFMRAEPGMSDVKTVIMKQSQTYGPDCITTFNANGQSYVIHTQQDFCYMEAGKITASVISGNAVITGKQTGAWGAGIAGKVTVRLD